MKRENYETPTVEQIAIEGNYPIALSGSGEDGNVSSESMDDYNI